MSHSDVRISENMEKTHTTGARDFLKEAVKRAGVAKHDPSFEEIFRNPELEKIISNAKSGLSEAELKVNDQIKEIMKKNICKTIRDTLPVNIELDEQSINAEWDRRLSQSIFSVFVNEKTGKFCVCDSDGIKDVEKYFKVDGLSNLKVGDEHADGIKRVNLDEKVVGWLKNGGGTYTGAPVDITVTHVENKDHDTSVEKFDFHQLAEQQQDDCDKVNQYLYDQIHDQIHDQVGADHKPNMKYAYRVEGQRVSMGSSEKAASKAIGRYGVEVTTEALENLRIGEYLEVDGKKIERISIKELLGEINNNKFKDIDHVRSVYDRDEESRPMFRIQKDIGVDTEVPQRAFEGVNPTIPGSGQEDNKPMNSTSILEESELKKSENNKYEDDENDKYEDDENENENDKNENDIIFVDNTMKAIFPKIGDKKHDK